MHRTIRSYILFYKPYGVHSRFTADSGQVTLKDYGFPKGVYSIGRLDADSEGLLILTNDGQFKHLLIEPKYDHSRTYAVQIENIPEERSMESLRAGIVINGKKTKLAQVRFLSPDPLFPPRSKPIRYRANIPTCWIEIILTEGRNKQIRKMTAAVGHPTLRLIRTHILSLSLDGLSPGEWRNMEDAEVEKTIMTLRKKL
ncbi:pseudouridine synthase [bacterium]|nr:MAG: pseudouridine synthase [bacterium]